MLSLPSLPTLVSPRNNTHERPYNQFQCQGNISEINVRLLKKICDFTFPKARRKYFPSFGLLEATKL